MAVALVARPLRAGDPRLPVDPASATAVVVDVLRATTTLTVALANGARGVEACVSPAEALARRAARRDWLACGERGGRIVPGFDLGNSPFEFGAERVAGKTLAFASTNGSLALLAARACPRRLAGAFVSAGALAQALERSGPRDVWVVCAGKEGGLALEDAAFAGWLCARLEERGARLEGAGARLARALAPRDAAAVRAAVEGSDHGLYLRSLGPDYARDVAFCASLDAVGRAFEL